MKVRSTLLVLLGLVAVMTLARCGGGGGGSSSYTPPADSPAPAWSSVPSLSPAEVGVSYSYQLSATGGIRPYVYSADSNKPGWLTVDSASGLLRGTPTVASASPVAFRVTATDSKGKSVGADVSLIIYPAISLDTSQIGTLRVGTACSVYIPILGGVPIFSATATGLPPGLNLSSVVSTREVTVFGTPTSSGSFPVTITVTDSMGGNNTTNVTFVVNKALIIAFQSFTAVQGRPFSAPMNVTTGTPPYTFTATSPLPFGLSLAPNGILSGTPFASSDSSFPAYANFTFSVTDSDTPPLSAIGNGTVILYGPIQLVPDITLNTGMAMPSSANIAKGGFGTITASLTSGTLPPGMAFNPSYPNQITGFPTQTGTFTGTFHAQDQANPPQFVDGTVRFTVQTIAPRISDKSLHLPQAIVGQPYSAQIRVDYGTPPFTLETYSQLPAGLTFDNGTIAGTPTEPGGFRLRVQLADSSTPPQTTFGTVYLDVNLVPEGDKKLGRNDTIATATMFGNSVDASISPYSDPSSAGPDQDYYKLTAAAGSTVTIDVTPNYPLDSVLEIVDENGLRYKTCNDPADDAPASSTGITADTTPNGFDDECMNDDVNLGIDKRSHLEFKVPGSTGQTIIFYAHVFDWAGNARPDATYQVTVSGNIPLSPLYMSPYQQIRTRKGQALSVSAGYISSYANGGTPPYIFDVAPTSPPFPAGLTMSSAGQISGTPTVAGRSAVIIQVSDAGTPKQTTTGEIDFLIADTITAPTSMPSAVTGSYYKQPFVMRGGVPDVIVSRQTWSPSQCCLFLSTYMSGIPKQAGDFTITYDISDFDGYVFVDTRTLTIHVDPGPLTVAASIPPRAKVYNFYDLTLTPNGGSAPFTFGITGTLPPGLSFNTATGELVGYPTQAGTYNVTLTTVDARSVAATPIPVSIVVEP